MLINLSLYFGFPDYLDDTLQIENNKYHTTKSDLMFLFASFLMYTRQTILTLFYVGIPILGIPLLYYSIEEKLTTELRRVYNINYSANYNNTRNYFWDVLSLIIGYIICGFVVSYTIRELCDFIVQTNNGTEQNITSIAFTSLALCFAVRYNTRKHGYERGKQILSLLFTAASIVFMITVFVGVSEQSLRSIYESTSFMSLVFLYFKDLFISFIYRVNNVKLLVTNTYKIIIFGSCISSVFGEIILTNSHNSFKYNFKNVYGFIPFDGPGYKLIPYYKLANKMQEMTKDGNFTSIRIISHTLETFEIIRSNLRIYFKKNIKSPNIMVIAPTLQSIEYQGTLVSLFNIGLPKREELKAVKYNSNLNDLSSLAEINLVKWVDKDLNDIRVIIVDNSKCLLIVDSLDMSRRKVGLYTDDSDLIFHFINIFDRNFSSINKTNV